MDSDIFVGDDKDHFICAICISVLVDPVEHIDCENLFCRGCVSALPTHDCPACRESLRNKTKPINRTAKIFYESLQRRCEDPRCEEIFAWPKQREHEMICPYFTVRCDHCGNQVQISRQQEHLDTVCPNYPVECPVPGCTHGEIQRRELKKHNRECWESHGILYQSRIKELEEENRRLKSRESFQNSLIEPDGGMDLLFREEGGGNIPIGGGY
jgi:hypothetical protein